MATQLHDTRHQKLRDKCNEFHRRHPEVWTKFVAIALELIARGHKKFSAHGIFAIIRYQTGLGDDGVTRFKINANYAAFYTRRFAREYPQHATFFGYRKQLSKERPATKLPELTPRDLEDNPM